MVREIERITPSVYANNRLQARGGVDLDLPAPPQMVRGGGVDLKIFIFLVLPPPPPGKSGKIAKNMENPVNSL